MAFRFHKAREDRRASSLPARMRDSTGWHQITVRNVSARGLMAEAEVPPKLGTFVEIRRSDICIVGQVRWSQGNCFGIRTQERIDFDALVAASSTRRLPGGERRGRPRPAARPCRRKDHQWTAEINRLGARLGEFATLVFAIAAGGIVLSQLAGAALTEPMERVAKAMAPPER